VLGALVLLSVGVWAFVLLTTGSDNPERDAFAGLEPDPEAPDAGEPAPDESDPPAADAESEDDAAAGEGDGGAAGEDDDARATERVDFDGACVVEVEDVVPPEGLRPWRFEECERAPISLEGTQQRWVAIVESLSGDDFSEAEALERIGADQERVLLWSSHYPSLNPGLWVIVEGPFESRAAATDAAQRLGGGAYPRALTDDEGDRYCVAADGCVGETRP
jgi:hypothetical protein